ncbi:MAG: twitch domain-containing radical SAM protein, partial [Acidobacteria bacterium]|nr:twitch domain-containing radical SAM protein [Acidobacteriota bacterium]
DGRASFCCDAPVPLTVDGRMGSVYRDSVDDLWNAGEVVQVRAAMARGDKPEACRVCWEREAAGGVSRRLLSNAAYRLLGGRLAVEALAQEGAATGHRLERRPEWYILELGNVCNLKCRSCGPLFSSRIAADALHSAWTSDAPASAPGTPPRPQRLRLAPENTAAWFQDVDAMADMVAAGAGAGGQAVLSLIGGEPFLIDAVWRLLDALVERGVGPRLYVGLLSNGQQRSARLAELAPRFRGFHLSLSIDAHGRLYEVLRHGASWRTLVRNLDWFREQNIGLSVTPTLQNGNALDMVELLRFLDERELRLVYNVLSWPARLRPANLPPSVRRIAAARLRDYLDAECRAENVAVVRGYCEVLEEAGDGFDAELFGEFMTFTNDFDASRGESLREAAPELAALVRAAGVEWSEARRHGGAGAAGASAAAGAAAPGGAAACSPLRPAEVLERVNRTVSASDALFAGFEGEAPGSYFGTAAGQLAEIDGLLRQHAHPGLAACRAVADFACHYGRMTRALRAALPHAAVYALDIDADAVGFCAGELGALPVVVAGWRPDEERLPDELDAVICVSLLTHTPLEHWRRALRAWARMLRPGGAVAFTFLSDGHLDAWLAGAMAHYGAYSREQRDAAARAVRDQGFGFAALTSGYGGEPFYGVAFASPEVVRREIAAAGLELLALPAAASSAFGQDLALARRPGEQDAPRAEAPAVRRDVTLVALYDPRCYAPAAGGDGGYGGHGGQSGHSGRSGDGGDGGDDAQGGQRGRGGQGGEGGYAESTWARLLAAAAAAHPPRPLPTELGFGDPRVPEVREAQAALAREHGVDAFCYLYPWGAAGPRWDAPWRDLLATGRPDFPFCLMVTLEHDGEPLASAAAARLLDDVAAGLGDRRYLRLEGRCLLLVRGVGRLAEPRTVAGQWRAAAAARGLGALHLCAAEPAPADRPEDLGFDSFLEAPAPAADHAGVVAAALTRPWPPYRLLRRVECRRDAADPCAGELYEHWLRSAVDETRRRGERVVFVDAWNDWLRGAYLEPDDRDGRAALLATRRAARGPSSGLVLLRRLREVLGESAAPAAAVLGELGQVLALHEHTRDRLLASVEVALGRGQAANGSGTLRWVPVASRQLPPSGGGFCLDLVGSVSGPELQAAEKPLALRADQVHLAGWAHAGGCDPAEVDLFVVLESQSATEDRVFRVIDRIARLDVAAALPGHPERCGFDAVVDLTGLPAGTYRVAIVQRTPGGTYRDATAVTVRRHGADGAACSSA